MNQPKLSLAPVPQEPSARASRPDRLVMRPGRKMIRLAASNGRGGELRLVFVSRKRGIEFWRSLEADRPVTRVAMFPGPFTPRAVANLLASGEAGPRIDRSEIEDAVVDGAKDRWSSLIRLAWSRDGGRTDAGVKAALALRDEVLEKVEHSTGLDDPESFLELGAYVVEHSLEWVAKWRTEIDAEVARRAELEARVEDEVRRRALRAFVETCLLTLGRMPRPDETAEAWDGARLLGRSTTRPTQRRLRLRRSGRVRRFQVDVVFWSAAETYGYSDFGPGPGWYWIVRNPDPNWRFCDPTGPYKTPEEAWEDAGCLGQDE